MNPKAAVGRCMLFGMVCRGSDTTPCGAGTALGGSWSSSVLVWEPFGTGGSVYPGGVATLLYIRKAQVLELDGA